jgi:hypothetical protein
MASTRIRLKKKGKQYCLIFNGGRVMTKGQKAFNKVLRERVKNKEITTEEALGIWDKKYKIKR